MGLRKGGAIWVEGDRFFGREVELEVLAARVRGGAHTLLTAPRRMGKTSLVRELQRRLATEGCFETIFVDLEDAGTPADAIAEIVAWSRSVRSAWSKIKSSYTNTLRGLRRVEEVSLLRFGLKLRAGIDDGNWRQKGDEVFAALAANERPVVVAIDELPVFLHRVLRGPDDRITPEGRRRVDQFMSWLRKIGQAHNDRIRLILTGSISLEPILRQAANKRSRQHLLTSESEALGRGDGACVPRRPGRNLRPRPPASRFDATCAGASRDWFPTTCNDSSSAWKCICAGSGGARRRSKTSSRCSSARYSACRGNRPWPPREQVDGAPRFRRVFSHSRHE